MSVSILTSENNQVIKKRVKANILTSRLPSEYQEVEYIQATGVQYIDSGLTVENSESWECDIDMQFTSTIADMWAGSNGYLQFDYSYINTTNRASIKIEYNPTGTDYIESVYVDGTLTQTKDWSGYWGSTVKFGIFRLGDNNDSWHSGVYQLAKLFSQKLYKDGVLVRNFIPCYRKSDNEIGLYDTVSGTFFTNEGDGVFLKGDNILSTQKCKINLLTSNPDYHNLPSDYQEVEYIQSTGTQYIDTGITASNSLKFVADFAVTNVSATRNYIIGSRGGDTGYVGRIQFSYSSSAFYAWGAEQSTPSLNINNSKHNVEISSSAFKIDDNTVYTPTSTDFSSARNVFLFAVNGSSGVTTYSNGVALYSCEIYDNNTLVRNYVPCYRKSDNATGLYDLVNNQFYRAGYEFNLGNIENAYKIQKVKANVYTAPTVAENI